MKRKKLLIIANKPLDRNYSKIVAKYDMVVRIKRMTNFDMCKGKTDLWLADVHDEATELFRQEDKEKFLIPKKAISFTHSRKTTQEFLEEIGYVNDVEYIPFESLPISKYVKGSGFNNMGRRVTNAIWMVIYCLEHYPDYEIHAIIDSNRSFLDSNIHNWHNKIYSLEGNFLNGLVEDGRLKILDVTPDTFKKGYTGNIPLFSSFWHNNESNALPELVVASINSFVKQGCPYNLYTYKNYINIPEGCVVKDANEIVPFSEFFMGARKYYSSFANYFRIVLVNKVDTAWTDIDNYFISDDFPTKNILISQEGRIQNSFFYLDNDEKGRLFKRMLLECYDNPAKPLPYDNKEMRKAKRQISIYRGKKVQLANAKWGFGGSCLFTNIAEQVDMEDSVYEYEKYFNNFHYTEQRQLWTEEEQLYMRYANNQVRILVMSLALLKREPDIMQNFKKTSYMGKLLDKYNN